MKPQGTPNSPKSTNFHTLRNLTASVQNSINQLNKRIHFIDGANMGSHTLNMSARFDRTAKMAAYGETEYGGNEKPRFSSNKVTHPLTYLEDMEVILEKVFTAIEIEFIMKSLKGHAKNWGKIYKENWSAFAEFKKDFLEQYWGDNEQRMLRVRILTGTWDRRMSMQEYFFDLVLQARSLTKEIDENQLINDIMRHFPKDIRVYFKMSGARDVFEVGSFLKSMDEIEEQFPKTRRRIKRKKNKFDLNENNFNDQENTLVENDKFENDDDIPSTIDDV